MWIQRKRPSQLSCGSLCSLINSDTVKNASFNASNFRLNFEWKDEFLSWNASQTPGIEDLRVDVDDIWVPDIDVFNLVSRKELRDRQKVGVFSCPEQLNR